MHRESTPLVEGGVTQADGLVLLVGSGGIAQAKDVRRAVRILAAECIGPVTLQGRWCLEGIALHVLKFCSDIAAQIDRVNLKSAVHLAYRAGAAKVHYLLYALQCRVMQFVRQAGSAGRSQSQGKRKVSACLVGQAVTLQGAGPAGALDCLHSPSGAKDWRFWLRRRPLHTPEYAYTRQLVNVASLGSLTGTTAVVVNKLSASSCRSFTP